MKKIILSFMAIFVLSFIVTTDVSAAGRLNFMLCNMTQVDIVDARLSPSYAPTMMTGNLLQQKLPSYRRLYIAPPFYGDVNYWNITLTWANGFVKMFPYMKLTRYNTYMAYANPYGVHLRQTYELAHARYDFTPAYTCPGYMGGPSFAVSLPEIVNLAANNKPAQAPAQSFEHPSLLAATTPSTHATRDLVFDESDDDKNTPTIAGTTAERVNGEKVAMKATVELTRDGQTSSVLPTEAFRSGDKVRLLFSTNRDGYIYWLAKGSSGTYQVLFPTQKTGMDNSVKKNTKYTVPYKGAWRFDNNKGTETLVAVLASHPDADLDKAVQMSLAGDKQGTSAIVERIVSNHETKRTTRDLVFDEENDENVNTRSQKANGDENFVSIYELMHN